MDVHAHGGTPDSYLSGNMHFDDYQTKTFYRSSFDPESKIGLPNKKGGCVIFPSYTQHYTEEHSESKPRVSVAFDLRLTGSFDKDFFNAIPFMNQDILKEIQEKAKKELDKNAESK